MKTTADDTEGMKIALQYYWSCLKRYPRSLWGIALSMPFTTLFSRYLPPLMIAHVLDKLIKHNYDASDLLGSFGGEMALFIAVLLVGIALWRLVDFFMWRLEQNIQQDIAEHVFRHLQSLSLNFHANNFGGSLVSQTNKLMGGYVRIQDSTIYQAYPMLWGILWAIIILAPQAPQYAIGLAIFSVIYLAVSWLLAKRIYVHLARFATAESKQTGMLADVITNIGVVKSFARSKYEMERFHTATSTTRRYLKRFAIAHQWQMNTQGLMSRVISSFAFIIAVIAVTRYNANIPIVFLMFNYTLTIVDQLFDFGNSTLRSYNRALSDAREMAMKLTLKPEVQDPLHPEKPVFKQGAINFENVTFRHDGADDAIFEGFTVNIKPGEKIGLVGHSGSGKTTFTRLLLRYSDIQGGAITIDEQNIAHVTQDSLHEHIAYVPQEPLLFHRSIRENIGYGDLAAKDKAIIRAAKLAHAHDF
ncbi:ABC transporter ATP-binding protein, partial [Candidatus Saccharibacteria bacterium]|nr:ABC transporter ATP-binding protein [Candidatus Saccharibacteria bacterium]